ncbi:MAG: carbon-nitrogen hydrolase family protein [Candidatus Poribacteria bacterium]|nr:carbon-nitrogen hydrolase family protein [Candidatus Poribacteria bacterium]HIM11281.1 carbon-nitrogen hydrolase family protein [Candidatus Poribacteria bacterium]HIO49856.1 carbon-nitrogen hydrolase family protein [Candidatus Poribacteria bacterium]HIO77578.1 carbon-nitrogen hydrolase family protein [Candidatus Poribacteria bacterium]
MLSKIKVSAIAIGSNGDYQNKLALALDHLKTSGESEADIACLPEIFAGNHPEAIPGPITDAVAKLARQYGMYVICPIVEDGQDKQYNTAVLIDRKGEIIGSYRKVFVFWGENLSPSQDGVKYFETDFGRICILTCFDINFPELWQDADELGAEIVFWPSAYDGGMPLNAFAKLYHYYIVPVGTGNIIDITGEEVTCQNPREQHFIATLDLDRTFIHDNYTGKKVQQMLQDYKGKIEIEQRYNMEAWTLIRSVDSTVNIRQLCRRYQVETLRQYQHRSRLQINRIRECGGVV